MRKIRKFYRNIVHSIQQLFYWLPIIWKDRDWDYHYIFVILRHKLQALELNEEDVERRNVQLAIYTLNRLIDDNYYELAYRQHEQKWGELQSYIKNSQLYFYYPNAKTAQDDKQARKEAKYCVEREIYLPKQDVLQLATIIQKHILHWWS
jgi:hypothetical protein